MNGQKLTRVSKENQRRRGVKNRLTRGGPTPTDDKRLETGRQGVGRRSQEPASHPRQQCVAISENMKPIAYEEMEVQTFSYYLVQCTDKPESRGPFMQVQN